jgi:hypothetical protein
MATQTRKRNRGTWQKLLQPIKLNARKRAACVLREARCAAPSGAVRATLEQAVAVEIERMRALGESEQAIQAFQEATELHIALCDRDRAARQDGSSVRTHDQPIAPHGDDVAPA